jgi:hypothetical protein
VSGAIGTCSAPRVTSDNFCASHPTSVIAPNPTTLPPQPSSTKVGIRSRPNNVDVGAAFMTKAAGGTDRTHTDGEVDRWT